MNILGIETSCDETAAAVVRDGTELLSNVVASSLDLHAAYGGVVPEIAARSHIEYITPVIDEALATAFPSANDPWAEIDGIAVTYGPGLGGSLLVGVLASRTLAILKDKPLYAANHVAAHAFANFLTVTSLPGYMLPDNAPTFPMLALIVSGGHTQMVLFRSHFNYTMLGQTNDDAVGEAFDKVAKIIGLPYPGGPSISKCAVAGNPDAYKLPKARMENKYDFSFSGLKTAVLRTAQGVIGESFNFPSHQIFERLTSTQQADLAASFQKVAVETLVDKTLQACEEFTPASIVVAGGVSANQSLRLALDERLPLPVNYTDFKLCTDNGAMIATYGCFAIKAGQSLADAYSLEVEPGLSM